MRQTDPELGPALRPGRSFDPMIITRQKSVPWLWVGLAHLPWAAMLFASAANTVVFTLEIRKFTANPAAIASLMTLTGFITMLTGPFVNWLSDRVWTRWGRRKIFYVPAVFAQATLILFVPFAPSLGWLALLYVVQFIALSLKAPNETLNQEIIPNHQRGRAAVINKIYVQFGLMAYNVALIGRFDDVLPGTPLRRLFGSVNGETLIFVVFSIALLSVVLLVSLGIKEIKPGALPSMREELGGRITLWRITKRLFIDVFNAEWWPLYLLALSQAMYGVKLGGMVALMYTDQWGYSTQVLGYTQGVAQLVSIFVVLLVFPIVDRFDKLRFFLVCLWLAMLGKLVWYGYVMAIVPDQRPSVMEILLIGEGINIIGQLAGIISYPLVYEFIPLRKLGTGSAGLALFRGFITLVMGPVMGLWLLYYSNLFMPGAGSQVLAVFAAPRTEKQMERLAEGWSQQFGDRIWVDLYKPYGLRVDASRQWAIRLRDPEAEAIEARKGRTEAELSAAQKEIDSARIRGMASPTDAEERKRLLNAELTQLRREQSARAEVFRGFLRTALGDELASIRTGLLAFDHRDGRVYLDVATAFPVEAGKARAFAHQLDLKLDWPEASVEVQPDVREPTRLTVSARPPDSIVHDGPGSAEVEARIRELAAGIGAPDRLQEAGSRLAAVFNEVVAGDRNSIIMPFPDAGYRPHKVDYFSSYLLMAGTDVIAILITVYLIRAEKRGKIRRRGKIEDEAARA